MNDITIFNNIWDVFSPLVVFIFGIFFIYKISSTLNIPLYRALSIYTWHTLFCILYVYTSTIMVADSTLYYIDSLKDDVEFNFGTSFVILVTRFFSLHLSFSYLSTFLIFNILGSIGLLFLDHCLTYSVYGRKKFTKFLASLTVFIPSLSFWSSAIGKDSITFLGANLALWAALDFRNRLKFIFISILLIALVRPHIAGTMIIALLLSGLFSKSIVLKQKIYILSIAIPITVLSLPLILNYIGLQGTLSANLLQEYIEQRQISNDGGSSVDISNMSLPLQMFTYIFRPLPYEAHSIFALISSLDNLFLLIIFTFFIFSIIFTKQPYNDNSSENISFIVLYFFLTLIVLSVTTANLGIAVRQKLMFMPMFLYLVFRRMRIDY